MSASREELIRETFELSREIGFTHFLAENFHRSDPVLLRLAPEERKAFLREWWDAGRERMYKSYLEQVVGMSNEELARNKMAYKEAMATGKGTGISEITPALPPTEIPGQEAGTDRKDATTITLRDQLFAPTRAEPSSPSEHVNERQHKR